MPHDNSSRDHDGLNYQRDDQPQQPRDHLDQQIEGNGQVMLVPLRGRHSNGSHAIIDASEAPRVLPHVWYVNERGYVFRFRIDRFGKRHTQRLHHVLLPPSPGLVVDHVNRNPLDNRRSNLRYATPAASAMNRRPRTGDVPYRGVSRQGKLFAVKFRYANVTLRLGTYHQAADAARVYDIIALLLIGDLAQTNFPAKRYRLLISRIKKLLPRT